MKSISKYIVYLFPLKLFVLAAVFHSPAFAYASCLALGLGFAKDYLDRKEDQRTTKTDDALKHKVEALEAALSAMISREKARGW